MRKFISMLLVCWFATAGVARAQTSLDQEMSGLAAKISKSLVAQGYKNVAALDFTDLQGQPTELGRFLSEELAVEIVSTAGVSMVDRANIKSILAEHKLTEAGLVDPANAKKLGEFAGVDAILIGNVTMLDDGIILMVKAIATSSAKIVAAGRIKFPKTSEIQQLLNRGISSNATASTTGTTGSSTSYQDANAIATKDIGPLRLVLKSVLPVNLTDRYGQGTKGIRCSFEFTSLETQRHLVVAMNGESRRPGSQSDSLLRSSLIDDRGGEWNLSSPALGGLGFVRVGWHGKWGQDIYSPSEIARLLRLRDDLGRDCDDPSDGTRGDNGQGFFPWQGNCFISGSTTPVEPGKSLTVVMNFVQAVGTATPGALPTFFQFNGEIVVGVETTNGTKTYSLHNLMFDRVSMPTSRGR